MAFLTRPSSDDPLAVIHAGDDASFDALDREWVAGLYRDHGALLFRGFPADLDGFHRFAGRFCSTSVFNESPDRLLLRAEPNIQTVNGGGDPFPLHPELSREPWKPDCCFFHCLVPAGQGGMTTICDGVALVRALPADLVETLARRRLVHIRPASPAVLRYWLGSEDPADALLESPPVHVPYRFRRTPHGIVQIFIRPVLHRPMFTDALAFGNFLLFARDYLMLDRFPLLDDGTPFPDAWLNIIRAAAERLTVAVAWQAGDLLMLDNSRFMHGRTAIADPEHRLIASFFGYLDDAPVDPWERDHAPWRRAHFRPPHAGPAQGPGV